MPARVLVYASSIMALYKTMFGATYVCCSILCQHKCSQRARSDRALSYRSLPEEIYATRSLEQPLISTRVDTADENLGESLESVSYLERLLRCGSEEAHEHVAAALWESDNEQHAISALEKLADEHLAEWEAGAAPSRDEREGRIDENRG